MLLPFITFLFVTLTMVLIGQLVVSKRRRILTRLERVSDLSHEEGEDNLRLPFRERIVLPALEKLGQNAARLTPRQFKARLERRLVMAGPKWRNQGEQLLNLGGVVLVVLPVLALVLALWANLTWGQMAVAVLLAFALAFFLPQGVLELAIKKRQGEIRKKLPSALDMLVISVEAGLGFDQALAKVAEKMRGILGEEFNLTLMEMQFGRGRRLALRDLASRAGVQELNTFIGAMIQADQLGVSIGSVLRVQADSMREKRRLHFQEQAMKAPIKMLFPLIFMIFPALFLIILGPAAIQIMKTFAGM